MIRLIQIMVFPVVYTIESKNYLTHIVHTARLDPECSRVSLECFVNQLEKIMGSRKGSRQETNKWILIYGTRRGSI